MCPNLYNRKFERELDNQPSNLGICSNKPGKMTIQRYASAFLSLLVGQLEVGHRWHMGPSSTWGLQAPDPARLGTTQQRLPSKTRQVELKNAGSYVGNANYINYIKIYMYICVYTNRYI